MLAALTPVARGRPALHAGGRSSIASSGSVRARRAAIPASSSVSTPGATADVAIRGVRGTAGRRLVSVGAGQVADVPDSALDALARQPGVRGVSLDRRVEGTLERTGATIGATYVQQTLGLDGTGVGIAVIDSGVTSWHDDLGSSRVIRFVDFVGFQQAPYDDYGHGTHVAGILAGSGYDSSGRRRGIAPGATLLVEKVLDASGTGYISNVIAAIDYAVANKDALNIRIINLSVAANVYESYTTDPLTLAAKRAVDAGIVVVAAAGNLGRAADGSPQYGGIGAPGNAPWVITVGASSHNGTADRSDDTVAAFSSRGPSAIDRQAKPDLVAPGVGIESLAEAGSTLYNTKPLMRLWGTVQTATEPYMSLSGTSMASPVVSGTIALMLQANPALTPNQVKAVLQFTAESHAGYDGLTEGAGFLNARGAVELAQSLAAARPRSARGRSRRKHVAARPRRSDRGRRRLEPARDLGQPPHRRRRASRRRDGLAHRRHLGQRGDAQGESVAWGTAGDGEASNIVWGTSTEGDNIVWHRDRERQHRLGHRVRRPGLRQRRLGRRAPRATTSCGALQLKATTSSGAPSTSAKADNIVWGTNVLDETDNIVWGASGHPPPVPHPGHGSRAQMKALPLAARIYVCAIIGIGAAMLAAFFPTHISSATPWLFIGLLLLSSVTSVFKVNLPLARRSSTMSVSYAVDFASLLLLGPNETMIVAAASAFSQCTFRIKERNPIHRTLFSMACLIVTVQAAGFVYHALGGHHGAITSLEVAKPLLGAASAYFALNTFTVATAIALSMRQPLLKVWHENFLWSAPSYFVGAGVAAAMAAIWGCRTSGWRSASSPIGRRRST